MKTRHVKDASDIYNSVAVEIMYLFPAITALHECTLNSNTLTDCDYLPAGTVFGHDGSNVATVVKQAKLYEAASNDTVNYKVVKFHNFKVGDIIAYTVGSKAVSIESILTNAVNYDLIGLSASLSEAIAAGEVLFEAGTAGSDTAALKVTPKGFLYDEEQIRAISGVRLSLVTQGTVYENRLPNGACDAVKAALPLCTFAQASEV